jgi:hypothetical protein
MPKTYPLEEIEEAFRNYYLTGVIYEDWVAWSQLFTDDAKYHDHFWGTFTGPKEIEEFLERTMGASPMVYAALKWYVYDETGRLVYENSNRADLPTPEQGYVDFPSLQHLQYAGNGKWSSEEDWWVMYDMKRFVHKFHAGCKAAGKPDFADELARRDFGDWVDWARPSDPNHKATPSWVGKDFKPILVFGDMDFGIRTETF